MQIKRLSTMNSTLNKGTRSWSRFLAVCLRQPLCITLIGGHHTANHPRGFPQINNNHGPGYPPGSGGPIQGGPNIGGTMNMMNAGVGPGRMNYPTARNNPPPMGYPGGGNLNGPGYPGYATTNMNNPGGYAPHPSQHTTPTHSPFSSSPSSSGYPNKSHSSSPLRRYILLPPPKQRKLHKTSDLGTFV